MAGDADGKAAIAADARRLRWKRAALVGGVALLAATAVMAYLRYHVPAAQEELLWYFGGPFRSFHARTRSIQSALAGLLEEPVPTPAAAVDILDENIVPTVDELLAQMRALRVHEIDTRVLHSGYVEAVERMREDALALRALFADPALAPAEQRRRAHLRLAGTGKHFDAFYARTVEIWRQNDIRARLPER